MLSSSANQYLRPEYLPPLPTTLDTTKCPLALLAQTCSQIGADHSTEKSLTASLDDKTSNSKPSRVSREGSSPTSTQSPPLTETAKSSFKPYESSLGRENALSPDGSRVSSCHSASGHSRTPGSGSRRCLSNQSASSVRAVTPQGRRTVTPNNEATRESPASRASSSTSASVVAASDAATISPVQESSGTMQTKSAYSPGGVAATTDPLIKDSRRSFKPASSIPVSTSSAYNCYPPQLPIDVMASSLIAQHHAALKSGLMTNPYMNHARMKAASTATDTLLSIGRDHFYTGSQLNPHFLSTSSASTKEPMNFTSSRICPAECAQCDHKPNASSCGPISTHTTPTTAYTHAQLAAFASASQLPYVCNWITEDSAYCGNRFSSSEELLQHLRSHTSISSGDTSTSAVLSLLSPPGLPPTHPFSSRTYPTPPLSPLATARYHPYGKPSPIIPPSSFSSLGLTLPPHHPALGLLPYFSPYLPYGAPRFGAAPGMHP